MSNRILALPGLLGLLFGSAGLATELGTPMDCTDIELAPGLTCTQLTQPGGSGLGGINALVIDNEGQILARGGGSLFDVLEDLGPCGSSTLFHMAQVYRGDGIVRAPILSTRSRCLDSATSTRESLSAANILFDAVRGSLLVAMVSSCGPEGRDLCDGYGGGGWIARIDGFAPLADVLPAPPPAPPRCDNGVDDDGDGAIDLDDRHCKSAADNDESRP